MPKFARSRVCATLADPFWYHRWVTCSDSCYTLEQSQDPFHRPKAGHAIHASSTRTVSRCGAWATWGAQKVLLLRPTSSDPLFLNSRCARKSIELCKEVPLGFQLHARRLRERPSFSFVTGVSRSVGQSIRTNCLGKMIHCLSVPLDVHFWNNSFLNTLFGEVWYFIRTHTQGSKDEVWRGQVGRPLLEVLASLFPASSIIPRFKPAFFLLSRARNQVSLHCVVHLHWGGRVLRAFQNAARLLLLDLLQLQESWFVQNGGDVGGPV